MRRTHRGVSATEEEGTQRLGGTQSAESPGLTSLETVVAWELRSQQTSATVKCVIEEYQGGYCLVRITHGNREVMNCWHISRGDATRRAELIQADLLHSGWDASET